MKPSLIPFCYQLLHGGYGKGMDCFGKKTSSARICPKLEKRRHFAWLGFKQRGVESFKSLKQEVAGGRARKGGEAPRDSRLSFQN